MTVNGASCSAPAPRTFHFFPLLPPSTAQRILILACRSPPRSCHLLDAAKRGRLQLDNTTTLSLSRVNKAFNALIIPLLWKSISSHKPSALLELATIIQARPKLALRIKNLHLGGEEMLVTSEWPLDLDLESGGPGWEELLCIRTTLGFDDMDKLPKWCRPYRVWGRRGEVEGMDGRDKAVNEALAYALRDIDVNPYKREYGFSDKWIGLEHWGLRIHELQACLDLYLMKMRKIEDAKGYRVPDWTARRVLPSPPAGRYSRLVVTGFSSPTSLAAAKKKLRSTSDVFVVSRAQLWKHLTRRGSPLDQFDHPILWARLGLHDHPFNENGERMVQSFLTGPHGHLFKPDEEDEKRKSKQKHDRHPMQGEEVVIECHGLAPHYTLRGISKLAHIILGAASRLHNLSLTGTFEMVLIMPSPTFETLKSLSLGPNMPVLDTPVHFNNRLMTLRSLENLRVCGPMLHPLECCQIAGEGSFLPTLKRVVWELVESCAVGVDPACHPSQYVARLVHLQGPALPASHEEPLQPRLIEIRLHPNAWPGVFSYQAPPTFSEALRQFPPPFSQGDFQTLREGEKRFSSWLAGRFFFDGEGKMSPNRIVCRSSFAASQGRRMSGMTGQDREGMRVLLRQAREWWEECAELGEKERPAWDVDWLPGQRWGRPVVLSKGNAQK